MCRHALQLLGMLGNVFDRPRHVLQRPWPTSACFYKVLGVSHRRETPPPHLLPYKLWNQGSNVPPSGGSTCSVLMSLPFCSLLFLWLTCSVLEDRVGWRAQGGDLGGGGRSLSWADFLDSPLTGWLSNNSCRLLWDTHLVW